MKNNKGFTLLEVLIALSITIAIFSLSISSIKYLNKKKVKLLFDSESDLFFQTAYLEILNIKGYIITLYNDKQYLLTYPMLADKKGSMYIKEDDFSDDLFFEVFIKRITNKLKGYNNGNYHYEKAIYDKSDYASTFATYEIKDKVKITFILYMHNNSFGGIDVLTIKEIIYDNLKGLSNNYVI